MHPTAQWRKGMLTNNGAELMDEGVRVKELFITGSHFNKLSMKQIDHERITIVTDQNIQFMKINNICAGWFCVSTCCKLESSGEGASAEEMLP